MLLKLYVLPEPAEPVARVAAAEALLPRVTRPELQRDAHIVIGRARLFHGQPVAGVLDHLVAADRIGGLTGLKRVELQLQIAELSRREKLWEQARVYFQRFLDENEVDGRIYTVKARLAEIAAAQRAEEATMKRRKFRLDAGRICRELSGGALLGVHALGSAGQRPTGDDPVRALAD